MGKKLEYEVFAKEINPKILMKIGILVSQKAKELCPVAYGVLRKSIGWKVKDDTVFVGTNMPYAPVMEFGRTPGGKMPPIEAIEKWCKFRGIPEEAVWAVAKSIAVKGIKVGTVEAPLQTPSGFRPWLRPAVFQSRSDILRIVKEGIKG